MSKTVTCTYTLGNFLLDVKLQDKVVGIDFTPYTQSEDLVLLYTYSEELVQKIKAAYKANYQKEIKISNASFIAEIWGHLVVYRIALWMKRYFKIPLLQKFAKFVAFRSGVIDCGEAKVDTNRWLWDMLGSIFFLKYK